MPFIMKYGTMREPLTEEEAVEVSKTRQVYNSDGTKWSGVHTVWGTEMQQEDPRGEPGHRYDTGKVPWDLLPYDALEAVAKVSGVGAEKYARRNWENGMSWTRIYACMQRHLMAMARGEKMDPESGQPHSAHVAWNALALCAYDERGAGNNDLHELVGLGP